MGRTNRLAERLKEMRRARGLTQRDMARRFGISDVGYGAWERGDCEPSIDNIMRLCQFFGCTADALIGLAPSPATALDADGLAMLKGALAAISAETDKALRSVGGFSTRLPKSSG